MLIEMWWKGWDVVDKKRSVNRDGRGGGQTRDVSIEMWWQGRDVLIEIWWQGWDVVAKKRLGQSLLSLFLRVGFAPF